MKTLAISHTYYPGYQEPQYWGGAMPVHPFRVMDSGLFNRWSQYIHDQNLKIKGWHLNKPRKGGVGFIDQQEAVLKMEKDLLR